MAINHSPADIVCQLMIDSGELTNPLLDSAWPAFVTTEPDTPDNVVTFRNDRDQDDGRSAPTGEGFGHLGVMVRIRAKTDVEAYDKAYRLTGVMEQVNQRLTSIDGRSYLVSCLAKITAPLDMGKNDRSARGRQIYRIDLFMTYRSV